MQYLNVKTKDGQRYVVVYENRKDWDFWKIVKQNGDIVESITSDYDYDFLDDRSDYQKRNDSTEGSCEQCFANDTLENLIRHQVHSHRNKKLASKIHKFIDIKLERRRVDSRTTTGEKKVCPCGCVK